LLLNNHEVSIKMAEKKEEKVEKKVSRIKAKKKLWYKIIAPKIFANKEVGESYLAGPEGALGRIVKINLRELTGNIKDQNNYIILQIAKASGSNLNTVLVGYELSNIGVKRAIRKNAKRLDDCFALKTKTGRPLVIKTLMVTVNKTQRSKGIMLRNKLREILQEELSKSDFNTFVSNLVTQKILGAARKRLNKIYPLRELAIRVLKLQEKGLIQEEVVVDSVEEKTPEPEVEVKEASETREE
jgi:small subunit ribosomal protein S3Ae